MDQMQALARTALETKCQILCPNHNHELMLHQARHPYLDEAFAPFRQEVFELEEADNNQMVPFTISLDDQTRGLIISGANTGGKTVTLKTTGLMAWMANSDAHPPIGFGEA